MDELDQNKTQSSTTSEDVAAYVNYYGLAGDPFDPEKPLFFATPQLEKTLRLFNYLARFSRKLVIVTGSSDAGKTALLESFVTGQDDATPVCSFAALEGDSPAQVLLEMAEQLKVPELTGNETPEQLSQAIRDYSRECLDDDNHCIVVIDDAELFQQPVLELIYEMTISESGQHSGVSFLLCGQPDLFEKVQQVVPADMMEKAIFHQQIAPFSLEDVSKYLHMHFIENAGQAKAPFSQNEYKQIFEQSAGLPGRINDEAKAVLLAAMGGLLTNEEPVKRGPKGFVMALTGVVVLAGAGFLWWQSTDNSIEATDQTNLGVDQSLVGQIERVEELAGGQGSDGETETIFVEPGAVVAEQRAMLEQSEAGIEKEASEKLNREEVAGNNVSQEVPAETVLTEMVAEQGAAASEIVEEITEDTTVPLDVVEERTVATHSAPVITKEVAVPEVLVESESKTPEKASSPTQLGQDMARILAFKKTNYTMQLLGSHKKESIQKILDSLSSDSRLMHYQKTHKGAPWYVLIYGNYPDRATANAAAANLPEALKGYKPWVRSVSGIQDTIKAAQ